MGEINSLGELIFVLLTLPIEFWWILIGITVFAYVVRTKLQSMVDERNRKAEEQENLRKEREAQRTAEERERLTSRLDESESLEDSPSPQNQGKRKED